MKYQYEVEGLRWRTHGVVRFINIGGGAREQVYAGLALSTECVSINEDHDPLDHQGFYSLHNTVSRKCIYRDNNRF